MSAEEMAVASFTVFDLAGQSCVIDVHQGLSVEEVKQDAARQLNIDVDGSLSLLDGCTELLDAEPLPSGDRYLVLISCPRPASWDRWVDEVGRDAASIDRMNEEAPEILRSFGVEFALEVLQKSPMWADPYVFQKLPAEIRGKRQVAEMAVSINGSLLEHVDNKFRSDRAVVRVALRNYTGCLFCQRPPVHFVSEELLSKPDIVHEALWYDPTAIRLVPDKLLFEDPDLIQTAVWWGTESLDLLPGKAYWRLTEIEEDISEQDNIQYIRLEEEFMSKFSYSKAQRRKDSKAHRARFCA